ncbi:MAG: uroporphyrinogen decarboxylase [Rhodospirillales bacterium]|nr:uroporphyrinogen decarboxylase [Rhodospirillales bacterium]
MSVKPILSALAGEPVWPPPVWLMRQAGRYLPEYRAIREKAGDFITLCTSPEWAAEVTLQPVRRFGVDAAILFSDILMLPWALGQGLRFAEGEGPRLPPLRDAAALAALDPGRLDGAIAPILETVAKVRAALDDRTALIGFAGAPFTVACYMVEGRGSSDFAATKAMAYGDPALFAALIDLLTESTIAYLSAQILAGAEVVMLFDSWAGMLAPDLFRAHVIAPAARIAQALRTRHPTVRRIGFPRLAGMMLGEYAAATGMDGLGMDSATDPRAARAAVGPDIALQGNLDPLALVAGGAAQRDGVAAILAAARGHPTIFNLGHGIVPHTPPSHVATLMEQVRAG